MSLPTIAGLCAAVPHAIVPAEGSDVSDHEISAVHISELADPTSYLTGGELLLTTGLSLPDNDLGCEGYVARLVAAGVTALGLGLGPFLSSVPDALSSACRRHGLCLLVVPPAAAFLTVTQAYWAARSRSTQQELTDAITAQRSLVDAVVSTDPVGQTLKALSRAIGAWVARLDPAGAVEHVFPSARVADALTAAEQITSIQVAGVHSSATFPSGDDVVAVFPLPLEDRVVGYIVVGSAAPMGATARRLVLTAGALLSLDSVHRRRADAATQADKQAVAALLDMGFVEPARRLASRLALEPLGDTVRVLVLRSSRMADVTEAVHSWLPSAMPARPENGFTWFVIPDLVLDPASLRTRLAQADPRCAAVLSAAVSPTTVHQARVGLTARAALQPPGALALPETPSIDSGPILDGLQRVLDHRRTDLVATLVAHLRHRGQTDPAAREVGVHRNTMRHRMATVRDLLGTDPDHPDTAAELWLHLRSNGLA